MTLCARCAYVCALHGRYFVEKLGSVAVQAVLPCCTV